MSDKIVAPQRIQKHPDEAIYLVWDFTALLSEGETINSVRGTPSVDSNSSPALTIGSPTIVGTTVKALFTGGADGTTYKVTCEVQTSEGQTWALPGILEVTT